MKKLSLIDYQAGRYGLQYWRLWTPGLRPYRSRKAVKSALEKGIVVLAQEKSKYPGGPKWTGVFTEILKGCK